MTSIEKKIYNALSDFFTIKFAHIELYCSFKGITTDQLTEITIPSWVTRIDGAFSGCTSLRSSPFLMA